jgi:hypothetical protein
MRRVRIQKERLYSKERKRKSIRNQETGNRKAKKSQRNKKAMQRNVGKHSS